MFWREGLFKQVPCLHTDQVLNVLMHDQLLTVRFVLVVLQFSGAKGSPGKPVLAVPMHNLGRDRLLEGEPVLAVFSFCVVCF